MTDTIEEDRSIHDVIEEAHERAFEANERSFGLLAQFLALVDEVDDRDLAGEIKVVFQQLQVEWSNVRNGVQDGRAALAAYVDEDRS